MKNHSGSRRKSINRRVYGLIALLVFFSALFSLANATAHYFDQQEKQFNEKNEQIAEATAAYFQDERLSQLAHLVLSPEFYRCP